MVIKDLRSDLTQVQDFISSLNGQLGLALFVRDQAWMHGYIEGLKKLRNYVILNP